VVNHSLRAWRPNAVELIDLAIEQQLDSVAFNTLLPFQSLEKRHLSEIRKRADSHDISIYVGVGGISERSDRFNDRWGDARTLVKEGIRVASALGSPVLGVRIGVMEDRYYGGGIRPKMEEVKNLMREFRGPVSDAGIRFAFENHAGDMRTEELLELMDETGKDICGAYFDPGNAIYAMEDPKPAMEALGEHIICCSARDVILWQSEEGAIFQWTAVGEGMMDFRHYTDFLQENCPGVPIHLEIISNSPRSVPFLREDFWEGWPDLKAEGIIDFLKMAREGAPIDVARAPEGMERKEFEKQNQMDELLKSIRFLREECGAGLK
jgi:sugar phosphate isomerase/epimerase